VLVAGELRSGVESIRRRGRAVRRTKRARSNRDEHWPAAGSPSRQPPPTKGGQASYGKEAGRWLRHRRHHAEAGVEGGRTDRGGDVETTAAAIVEIPGAAEDARVRLPRPRVIPFARVAPLVERAVVASASRKGSDVCQVVLVGSKCRPRHGMQGSGITEGSGADLVSNATAPDATRRGSRKLEIDDKIDRDAVE
jgi:hypothetical protein